MTNLNPTNTPLKWRLVAGVIWAAVVVVFAALLSKVSLWLSLISPLVGGLMTWLSPQIRIPAIALFLLKRFGNPQPANTYPLEALAGKVYPNTSTAPELLGRDTELAALAEQCRQAPPNRLRVVSVWGPQGIGKTHLLYAFGKKLQHNAQKVLGQNSPTWRVWVLKRKFEAQALFDSLPSQPCLLLWDDISLSDGDTKTRLDDLRQLCTQHAQPLLIVLTTWSEQSGLTANDRGVDAELPCPPLDSASAQRLYADVKNLPPAWQGHPLLLRLLQEAGGGEVSISDNNLQAELWRLCLNRADALIKRYRDEHTASDEVLCAIAVASSGDALPLADVAQVFGLEASALQKTLKQLSLCTEHQGLLLLAPLRPDLIGWAFAHQVLQAVPAQRLQTWAALVWHYDFFDTGRFLEYAQQADFPHHPWVQALHSGVGLSAPAVLNRAQAAVNATDAYGRARMWSAMQAELAVCQDLAQKHPNHAEIQLARAQAAVNAIDRYGRWADIQAELVVCQELAQKHPDHAEIQLARAQAAVNATNAYGSAQRWDEAQAELAVCQDLAQRYPDHAEIQLRRAQAAFNAIIYYGSVQRWDEMQAELVVCQELAQKHPDNAEIQLRRAQAAVNAIGYYGSAQRWSAMQTELAVCQELAQKHPDHAEIQLERAKAAVNAIILYGSAQRWDEMQAELAVCQELAQKHPDHAEIQLERAKAAVNAIIYYHSAQRWDEVQAELVVCQNLAQKYPGHAEIQLRRAQAAVNAIHHYGRAQMLPAMQAELVVCQDLAHKHPNHAEIQLARDQAAVNAIIHYGSAQMLPAMQAEMAVFQKIAERFPDHAEIQKRWAELNAWLNEHQKGKHPA